ncbi:MAG: ribosome assembly RNA-binding protein YhbY [Myxococcales bacterium]|nr:ribosome assembly RNA-binding protein YhbY [Myxococcales bacterium]
MELTGKQRRHLRGLAHHLHPVVYAGKEGVSEAVERKATQELENHEIIKLKLGEGCVDDKKEAAARLAAYCNAAIVQVIGKTIVLYRRRKSDPTIVLPAA